VPPGVISVREFLTQVTDYQLFKDSVVWSYVVENNGKQPTVQQSDIMYESITTIFVLLRF
jgi:hypothetical protein